MSQTGRKRSVKTNDNKSVNQFKFLRSRWVFEAAKEFIRLSKALGVYPAPPVRWFRCFQQHKKNLSLFKYATAQLGRTIYVRIRIPCVESLAFVKGFDIVQNEI